MYKHHAFFVVRNLSQEIVGALPFYNATILGDGTWSGMLAPTWEGHTKPADHYEQLAGVIDHLFQVDLAPVDDGEPAVQIRAIEMPVDNPEQLYQATLYAPALISRTNLDVSVEMIDGVMAVTGVLPKIGIS